VKLAKELWRSEEINLLLRAAAPARAPGNRRRCFHGFLDDLEKCLSLLAEWTVAGVDDVEAAAKRFGVEQFNRD
jgi:hypothetical protein